MELERLLDEQGGVATRAQLLRAGVSSRQLRGSGRRFVRVRHGVYVEARVTGPEGRVPVRVQVAAARLLTGVDLVATGATAVALHGLPLLGRPPGRLELRERKQERPLHHGASATLLPDEVVGVDGVPVTSLACTAVDVARVRGFLAGVLVADAVLRRGVPPGQLEDALLRRARWPGLENGRRAVAFADGRAESALESLGRVRFDEQGLPPPELQVWRGEPPDLFARVDHYWRAHRTVAEADGALKYATPSDLWDEKRREDRLRDGGDEVVRYTWDEALHRPALLAARLRRAFDRSARRRAA